MWEKYKKLVFILSSIPISVAAIIAVWSVLGLDVPVFARHLDAELKPIHVAVNDYWSNKFYQLGREELDILDRLQQPSITPEHRSLLLDQLQRVRQEKEKIKQTQR